MSSLSGKVAIITGASHGIGLACARRFARDGAKVVLADVDEEGGKRAASEIAAKGGAARFIYCDVAERLDIHNLVAAALDEFDRIDVLVNNAGIADATNFFKLDDATFDKVLRVNVKGAFLAAQAVGRQFIRQIEAQGEPRRMQSRQPYAIINMSSIDAVMVSEDHVAAAVSKGAVNQLTRALAVAMAPWGIRVNAIGPGTVSTGSVEGLSGGDAEGALERTPLGRFGAPEEIAAIAAFLASDDASYITGQCIYADGGRLALNFTMPQKG